MKPTYLTYIVILILGIPAVSLAQIDSTSIDSVLIDTTVIRTVDTTAVTPTFADTLADEEKPLFKVTPWEFHQPLGAAITATDSTLRWQIWPDWTYKLNREPGVISYRMGTNNRSNAVQRFAHEPRHQQLYWEGISLNDPISGMLHWSLIPQHKIDKVYGQDLGTHYRTTYYLRQYYLNKPLSRLIYSESKFSFRNLEFEVSHNLSQRMNIELSYWDRRAGGEYANSEVIGRQIYAKASYHLDHRHYLKLNYINNKLDVGRPFGYALFDMQTFNFDHYSTQANMSSGRSVEIHNLLALNLYRRSADSTKAVDNFHAGLYRRTIERSVTYSADSTSYKVNSIGLTSRKWWSLGNLNVEAGLNYEYFFNKDLNNRVLTTGNWGKLNTEGKATLHLLPAFSISGGGAYQSRTDGHRSYRLNVDAELNIGGFRLSPGLSKGTVMPTPQQLYWQSNSFAGNPDLSNEQIQEAHARLSYHFTPDTEVGLRVQHKDIKNGLMVGTDSTFTNVDSYASQSATAFFNLDSPHFELKTSATYHKFGNSFFNPDTPVPMLNPERIWLKGGVYWKGYLFNRATYVKAGLSGMLAPFRYQADHYNPELDYWQPISTDEQLPVFNRLDLDITARVRSIIFVLRWQNILDDVGQLGYFETALYPMSQRRFLFGVRALFRN